MPFRRRTERFGVVDDYVVAVGLAGEVAPDDARFEPAGGNDFLLQVAQDGAVFLLDQAGVVLLRGGLELPLVFEERGLVDVGKDLAKIEVLLHANAVERRLRDVGSGGDGGTALCGDFTPAIAGGSGTHPRGASKLFYLAPFGEAGFAAAVGRYQVFHDVQAVEGVAGVEDAGGVLAAQVVLDV